MAEQREHIGLGWVTGEVKTILAETRRDLERYAEPAGDNQSLETCRNQLQHAHSTLKMLGQHGSRLLTGEMLALISSMENQPRSELQDHVIALMQGMLLLPNYLEEVYRTGRERPEQLKKLLAQMRDLRNQPHLKEIDFFVPNLNNPQDPLLPEQLNALKQKGFVSHVKRIRHKYQSHLTCLLRNQHREKQLTIINKVFSNLQNLCWGAPATLFWDAALGLGAGLRDKSIPLNAETVFLLREMDHQMKLLAISDAEGINDLPDETLLRSLFYQLAQAKSADPLITSLKFNYHLEEALEAARADASEAVITVETAEATANALHTEIKQIRQMLRQLMVRIHVAPEQLQELQAAIRQLAGTMMMLGFSARQKQLHQIVLQLRKVSERSSPATATFQDVEKQLLQIEQALKKNADHQVAEPELQVSPQTISTARQHLEGVKQAVSAYLANQNDLTPLKPVPDLLHSVVDELNEAALTKASLLAKQCGNHIQSLWLEAGRLPLIEELEALTDLITSIDYSLEQYSKGTIGEYAAAEAEGILDVAETSLSLLQTLAQAAEKVRVPSSVPEPEDKPALSLVPEASVAPANESLADNSAAMVQKDPAANNSPSINEDDQDIIDSFIEEAREQHQILATVYPQWQQQKGNRELLTTIRRCFHTLKGSGRMVGADVIGGLAWSVENMLNKLLDEEIQTSAPMLDLLREVVGMLPEVIDDFASDIQQLSPEVLVCMEKADALCQGSLFVTDENEEPETSDSATDIIDESSDGDDKQNILQLFLEESFELIESSARALELWLKDTSNLKPVNEIQRLLHTLKGGARMAELPELDELCHSLEDVYGFISTRRCKPKEAPLALIQHAHDTIETMLRSLAQGQEITAKILLVERLQHWQPPRQEPETQVAEPGMEVLPDYIGQKTPTPSIPVETEAVEKESPEAIAPPATITQSGEMIRIPLDLLENLINLTGESSISRSRVEQQITDATKLLDEVSTTVTRIREQVRRIDTESLQQIQAMQRGDLADTYDLNLAELDQHSEMTQLSRALIESASDLMDLREALQNNNLETEKILRQQSSTQIELQEQLMQARMVSFGRLVPRLRQIVRLVSSELDKPVELIVTNAEGEIDRTMLEHILAPLEHMLRNAISHGIEDQQNKRLELGKPAQGQIEITIDRDGNDIVIELSDDGRGIDPKIIKARAIEQGFITEDAHLTDLQIMQLIFESGFTTAGEVTHISGRGVGLDVVNSEVRQLGGHIVMDSKPDEGSRFSMRLPFTQSVNRALMVEVGPNLYALPMQAIDGIAMISPDIMRDCYDNKTPLKYGGVDHKVVFLGELLDIDTPKRLGKQCPVVLVQRGPDRLALHVDTIIGSREMITKSLGAQLAGVTGINGATILGDGRVVVIIDPIALYHRQQEQPVRLESVTVKPRKNNNRAIRVLVIDDSVTVRKVASRLLIRQGYEVDSARDGVEAMAKLTEEKPDIVLLDIEMPNIDGFEVANTIRNDPLLKEIPIIMITSRTGEKHRNRALSLGINEYIGKPFQEKPLLDAIQKLTTA